MINAALAAGFDDVLDLRLRLESLTDLRSLPEWSDLVTVVERTYNITRGVEVSGAVNELLFEQDEERELWRLYCDSAAQIQSSIERKQYREASLVFARAFAEPVHAFFDQVFVNVEKVEIRDNRMRLIKAVNQLYSERIADLSKIVVGPEQ